MSTTTEKPRHATLESALEAMKARNQALWTWQQARAQAREEYERWRRLAPQHLDTALAQIEKALAPLAQAARDAGLAWVKARAEDAALLPEGERPPRTDYPWEIGIIPEGLGTLHEGHWGPKWTDA